MKQLRRFWRRNAGLLGVLCGAALLLAAVLYLNSGQPVHVELAQPSPAPTPIPTPEPVFTPEPTVMPTPEITPLPEEAYEHMYSNVRGMDGKRLFDWEKVDFSVPPPGATWEQSSNIPGYSLEWIGYVKDHGNHVYCKGYVISAGVRPPEDENPKAWLYSSLYQWDDFLDKYGEKVREFFPDFEDIDVSKEPPGSYYNFKYAGDTGKKKYMTAWLDYQEQEAFIWGDWIITMDCPPPGYDPMEDTLAIEYLEYMHTEVTEENIRNHRKGMTYADWWRKFFDENSEMLHIDWPSPFAA